MIGGEPYTLGLFDTAGMSTFCPSLHFVIFWVSVFCLWVFLSFSDFPETYLGLFLFFSTRSGRLWPVTSSELSADRCLPGLFFCRVAVLLWKRQRKSASVRNPFVIRIARCLFKRRKTWRSCCVCSQWVPEITHHCPKTPFLLVGTQIDLRDDPSTIEKLAKNKQKPITPETAEKLARDLKAVKYVECSALTQVPAESDDSLC